MYILFTFPNSSLFITEKENSFKDDKILTKSKISHLTNNLPIIL